MAATTSKSEERLAIFGGPNSQLLSSTAPGPNADLHGSLEAGTQLRALAVVTIGDSEDTWGTPLPFSDLRSVPAALPPLPNAGGLRGGHPSYAAQQGNEDFLIDYGFAFCLRQAYAFTRHGFGSSCIGPTCKGKVPIYSRGFDPFIWDRKRNRGGAFICPDAGGHLLCLRCLDALYTEGRPIVSSITGEAIDRGDLFRKYEAVPASKEVREVQPGHSEASGGHQFFAQRRDLSACPCCKETKGVKRGVKRALESGPTPKELGPMALLQELKRGTIPPTIVAPGLYLIPHLSASDGRLLDLLLTEKGPVNLPRLVKLDHMGAFQCLCGQKTCKDHDVSMLREAISIDGWWQSSEALPGFEGAEGVERGAGAFESVGVGGIAGALEGSKAFMREMTTGTTRVLPIKGDGHLGEPLIGLNAEAWLGPRLRLFVVCNGANETAEAPAVCIVTGRITYCSRCPEEEQCVHVKRVVTKAGARDTDDHGNTKRRPLHVAKSDASLSEKRPERVALRASRQRHIRVCNDSICRRPDSKVPCPHRSTLESWECLSAAAMDMGHSHKRIDTIMRNGGKSVTSLCERWGDEGVRERDEAMYFCAPRPVEKLSPCGRKWQLETRSGSLTTAGARYPLTTYRRVCKIAPGREAACCSVANDGQVRIHFASFSWS
jgi:hypothetical protein